MIVGAVGAVLVVAAFVIGRHLPLTSPPQPPKPQRDTIYLRDSTTSTKPSYAKKTKKDTVWLPAGDTVHHHDTTWIPLQREQLEWRDSLATVWASGVDVAVDSVRHYVEQMVVTEKIPVPVKVKPRWSLGVTAGYGAGKDGLTPYVGVGVTYSLLSW